MNNLLRTHKISIETICIAAKISKQELMQFLNNNLSALPFKDAIYLSDLAVLLDFGMSSVSDDERIMNILKDLISNYKMDVANLSLILDTDEITINKILNNEPLELALKYHISVKICYLFYIC